MIVRSPPADLPSLRRASQLLEVPPTEVPAAEIAAPKVAPPEAPAAVVPPAGIAIAAVVTAAKEAVGGERLPEQEPGEQSGAETEAAPVRRSEAGVDVVDRGAVDLHLAHLGLDALIDLVRAGRASRYVAAGPAIRGRPVDIAHRHAVPRIEEARRAPIRLWLAGREGFGAGQVVVSLGDGLADGPHIRGPPGRIERRGPALIGAQCRA